VKSILPPTAAKESFERTLFSLILLAKSVKTVFFQNIMRLCEKYFAFAAYGSKSKIFRAAFSTILLRKIVENAALKKYYLAA